MKRKYLNYYSKVSAFAPMHFMFDAIFTKNKRRKISLLNRQRDYNTIQRNPELLSLHQEVNGHILNACSEWDAYDYGEGYLYQSLKSAGFSGLRDTEARISHMDLKNLVRNKSVLEIGCNTGFISVEIADDAKEITAFDLNPHLIDVAKKCAKYKQKTNIDFRVCSFSSMPKDKKYEVVLSFANHSTYDGKTDQSIHEYFMKCYEYLEPEGLLIFESHPPIHEGDGLPQVISIIENYFKLEESKVLTYGTFLDTDRTFIIARKVH